MAIENYKLVQINENSWSIEAGMVRAFLFVGSESALLVDTTAEKVDLLSLIRTVTDLPIILVNTHADPDHISSNSCFEEAFMHPSEFAYYDINKKDGDAEYLPLWEGDIIDLGDRSFEVIHIPGHTYGSIALLAIEDRFLVSGDSISLNPIFIFGEMRNMAAFQASLMKLRDLSDAYDVIYASHGPLVVEVSQIDNILACADDLLAGKIEPQDPPFPMPAKMYKAHNAGFYYIKK